MEKRLHIRIATSVGTCMLIVREPTILSIYAVPLCHIINHDRDQERDAASAAASSARPSLGPRSAWSKWQNWDSNKQPRDSGSSGAYQLPINVIFMVLIIISLLLLYTGTRVFRHLSAGHRLPDRITHLENGLVQTIPITPTQCRFRRCYLPQVLAVAQANAAPIHDDTFLAVSSSRSQCQGHHSTAVPEHSLMSVT